jgi:hypothetical protein
MCNLKKTEPGFVVCLKNEDNGEHLGGFLKRKRISTLFPLLLSVPSFFGGLLPLPGMKLVKDTIPKPSA